MNKGLLGLALSWLKIRLSFRYYRRRKADLPNWERLPYSLSVDWFMEVGSDALPPDDRLRKRRISR